MKMRRSLPRYVRAIDFRPPTPSEPFIRSAESTLPMLIRAVCGIVAVDIDDTSLGRLKAHAEDRLLITPNHPSTDEPWMLFALGKAAGMRFNFVSARELFNMGFGGLGWVLQHVGAYSIVRGTPDRESFRMTRQILSQPAAKLVIFPEGEIYSQNDSLLPFQSGVVQLAFWAMEDLRKEGMEGSVKLLPVGVRYTFVEPMEARIDRSLDALERATFGPAGSGCTERYARLRAIGGRVLQSLEAEYGLKPGPLEDEDMTARMNAMKELLLARASASIGITLPDGATVPDRMRLLMNKVFAVTREEPSERRPTPYEDGLHREKIERMSVLLGDLERVSNWMAVEDNYVRANPSPDRMADNIRRLEVEVFGQARISGKRRAIVRVGEPIDLGERFDAYKTDRRATVSACIHELEDAVTKALREAARSIGSTGGRP